MILLRYGNTNTYFLNGLLIDTDMPGTLDGLFRELKKNGLRLGDIRYVMATHYHPDHMGLISELMAHGVRLLLIDRQAAHVHFSDPIFARQPLLRVQPIREEEAVVIRCDESRRFLAGLGIRGEIIPTDSHSADGVALITDDGDCLAGDIEPLSYLGGYEDNVPLKKDWDAILSRHPATVYFGHSNAVKVG